MIVVNAETSYWAQWGLAEDPFAQGYDRRFVRLTNSLENALTLLYFTVQRNRGAACVTGETGSGKSTLLHHLKQVLVEEGAQVLAFSLRGLTPVQLLRTILQGLGCPAIADDVQLLRQAVHLELFERAERGPRTILMLDDVDAVEDPAILGLLDELTKARVGSKYLINCILAGGSTLVRNLSIHPEFFTRLAFQVQLAPLTAAEASDLIRDRFAAAGWKGESFPISVEAVELLHQKAAGNPGRICQWLHQAMANELCARAGVVDPFYLYQVFSHGETAA
ncbi:MAG: AAA family ATPase [Chthonomonas sp.]|nr:AAA family ATPase [Chthonomonas sp.]